MRWPLPRRPDSRSRIPFAVTRLDGGEIEKQPGRLTEEVASIPMFSDKRLIWVRGIGAGAGIAAEVAELAKTTPADAVVLLEAGELKKGTGLRAAVEKGGIRDGLAVLFG